MKKFTISTLILMLSVWALSCTAIEEGEVSEVNGEWETLEQRTQYKQIKVTKVATGFERPWAVAFLPDGKMLVTERPGRLTIVENGEITTVEGTPEVRAISQGGMLDVVLHPNYEENGWIYLTYSKGNENDDTATALVRGRLDGNNFIDTEELFVQNRYSSPGRHYGSRLAWDNQGYLYMSIGDRGSEPPRAQDLSDHAGTLLRLNDDGTVPDDNPFVNDPDAANEIFSYGHRNIQGMIINPENNEIWATEHGPRGGDELNLVEAGENYGWPDQSLGRSYRDETQFHEGTVARSIEGMVDPVYEFLPTLAPSGLALVTSEYFEEWNGNLLAGGLGAERIRRLLIEDYTVLHDEEILHNDLGRIRDVRQGPDGFIYILNDADPGTLFRVEPNESE